MRNFVVGCPNGSTPVFKMRRLECGHIERRTRTDSLRMALMRSWQGSLSTVAAIVLLAQAASANVGNKAQWTPAFTVEVQAPPPADAAARAKAFEERNSREGLEKLAKEFFGLIDLGKIPKPARDLYQKGDFEGALNAYRDFFVERLRLPPPEFQIQPRSPAESHYPFLTTADDLMGNVATFGMIAKPFPADVRTMEAAYSFQNNRENPRGNVRVSFGPPGRVNWTWQPADYTGIEGPRLPYQPSFASRCYGSPTFFSPLLAAYLQTRDGKYLARWAELNDDAFMNLRRDVVRAGFDATHDVNCIELYTTVGIFPNLAYLARTVPDFAKDLPAPALARLLLRMWKEFVPEALASSRNTSSARRLVFYMWHALRLALSFPEFRSAGDYCVREYVRILESYATVSTMPDGVDVHDSRNYNKIYMREAAETFQLLCRTRTRPAWINALWHRELVENSNQAARFIIRELWINGGYSQWGPLQPEAWVFSGPDPYWLPCASEALIEPDNARILSAILGDGSAGAPGFTSDCFPYGGYYMIRTGWGPQDQWMYMPSTRPVGSVTHGNCNNFHLAAFGQNLLIGQTGSPVTVDGCSQIDCGTYANYPEKYRRMRFEPLYGKSNGAAAYDTVLKRRWHTSEYFDLCEGTYDGPFARNGHGPDKPGAFIDDVTHSRQILFARKIGAWVVIDRLKSPTDHTYQLHWPLFSPRKIGGKDWPGFADKQIAVDEKAQAIRTHNEATANLSIYHFSPTPLKVRGKDCELAGPGEHTIVSLLYPRKTAEIDLKDVKPLDGEAGRAGFTATTADGTRLTCSVAAKLEAGGGEVSLTTVSPGGEGRGIELRYAPKAGGPATAADVRDFESDVFDGGSAAPRRPRIPIRTPMDGPEILPQADRFADELQVSMSHGEKDTVIRYTLDGSEPGGSSPLYEKPVTLRGTTVVKARAFRKGLAVVPPTSDCTGASAVTRALYEKAPAREPAKVGKVSAGLAYACYEGEDAWPISALNLAALAPAASGTTPLLFDTPGKNGQFGYAFVYTGYLDIPRDGVYSFHAPKEFIYPPIDAGYDLRVFLDNEEWYPATRRHNWGAWSVPLKAGKHSLRVVFIDQRNSRMHSEEFDEDYRWTGEKPQLTISGPGLERQPIPPTMLCH